LRVTGSRSDWGEGDSSGAGGGASAGVGADEGRSIRGAEEVLAVEVLAVEVLLRGDNWTGSLEALVIAYGVSMSSMKIYAIRIGM